MSTAKKNIFEIFKPPFKYERFGQKIFDSDNNLILDIRGWGIIQKHDNAEEIQDDFGRLLEKMLNAAYLNVH